MSLWLTYPQKREGPPAPPASLGAALMAAGEFLGILHEAAALLLAALLSTGEFLGILHKAAALLVAAALLTAGKLLGVLHEATTLLLAALLAAAGEFLGVLCNLVHESSPPSSGRSCQPRRLPRPVSRRR